MCTNLPREEIVDVEYNMVALVDLAWVRELHMGFRISNEESMEGNDVDDQPTPIVRLPQAGGLAQLILKYCRGTSFEALSFRCDELQPSMDKLCKMPLSHFSKTH